VCAAGEENFAVCVRQARSHLFAFVVVHCKVVSTLDKRNTKSHLIKLKSRQEGLLAIIHDKRREHDRTIAAAAPSLSSQSCKQLSIHRRLFEISLVLLACVLLFELIK